ncbi:MAG TPA: hypothetical protein VJV23_06495 [Candidatus Polarisedimenticolia bacterium]|nr:hypothetical protein [Candidatus Polarisedimenticolia bacterium]
MLRPDRNVRLRLTVLAVGLSVFLFACGGSSERGEVAERLRPYREARASAAAPARPAEDQPAAAAAAPDEPSADSGETVPAEGEVPEPAPQAEPRAEVSFGSGPPEEAAEPYEPPPPPRLERDSGKVFSNDDLKAYKKVKEQFGFGDNRVTVDATHRPAAVSQPKDQAGALTTAERDAEMSAARESLNRLSEELRYLQGRIPSLHNPFLPRAAASESDASAEAGMDNAEKLAHVNSRIAEVNQEMARHQRRLADLQLMTPSDAPPSAGRD